MCRRIAQGRRFSRCGHFLRLNVSAVVDCQNRMCEHSICHPKTCKRDTCIRNFGPDIEEDIQIMDDHCWPCNYAASQSAELCKSWQPLSLVFTLFQEGSSDFLELCITSAIMSKITVKCRLFYLWALSYLQKSWWFPPNLHINFDAFFFSRELALSVYQ